MSAMQLTEDVDSSADLQIWNNAAFDNGEISEDLKQSWGSLKSVFANPKASFDSVSDKENQGSMMENQISSVSSSTTPFKLVNTDVVTERSRIKAVPKMGLQGNSNSKRDNLKEVRDEKEIDKEIEAIESEICRLSSRLEALRLEKAERVINTKAVEKRGRVIPAKFMEQKQSTIKNNTENMVPISSMSARKNVQRRGLSLGPAEIVSSGRRGMSMGPTEIFGSIKSKQLNKQEMITPSQNRRKSCFWKLQDIDEEKVVAKEKGKSCSVSPKSRKLAAKTQASTRQAVTTITSRKTLKKEDVMINSIQPKKLFKDGEKSVIATNKKPLRPGRVVPSRYNQSTTQASAMRKRSLPENDKDDGNSKKRSLSIGKTRVNLNENKNVGSEIRVKRRWEIPNELVVHGSGNVLEVEKSPMSVVNLLPRIRIDRCVKESPRDSGPAKKAVELIGKKSFFASDEEMETSVCQALTYAEEYEEIEES